VSKVRRDLVVSPDNVWESSVSIAIELRGCVNSISNDEDSSLM
jgi:hypothetical protein